METSNFFKNGNIYINRVFFYKKMNKNIRKLVFELTKNSRNTTKNISKKTKISQQSVSYSIKQLKKKRLIQGFTSIIDAVKLGFTNIIVGFNYLKFDTQIKKEILEELKNTESVISIQESTHGLDLIVEYSANNLSAFNKTHSEFIHKFHKSLETKFIFPIIVKHKYQRNYLVRKFDDSEIILCGDRKIVNLSKNELSILQILLKNPNSTFVSMCKFTKLSVKSIIKIKKKLERLFLIRGYSCFFNHSRLGINRYLLFLKLSGLSVGEINKLIQYCKSDRNIVELIKIIGEYQIILTIEELQKKDIINELRSMFPIEDYLLVEVENIQKESYLPLINS